jgi:hypothetical protein
VRKWRDRTLNHQGGELLINWDRSEASVRERYVTGVKAEMVPCGADTILVICFSAAWGQSIRGEPAP